MGASGSKAETLPPVTYDQNGKQLGRCMRRGKCLFLYAGKCMAPPRKHNRCDFFLFAMFRYSGKKICCSCPDTKEKRDECVAQNGQDKCGDFIEAHKACLRKEGFTVA